MSAAADIVSELERVRDDYRRLIAAATPEELLAPTWGTGWTNRELLFHMWFGQHLARVFVPLFGGFGRLPRRVSIGHGRCQRRPGSVVPTYWPKRVTTARSAASTL